MVLRISFTEIMPMAYLYIITQLLESQEKIKQFMEICQTTQKLRGDFMYNLQEIVIKIKEIAKSNGISTTKMLEECGLNKNTLSTMSNRGSWVQADSLAKIADYLDCSVDYLLGRTELPEINTGQNIKTGNIGNGNENIDNSIKISFSESNKIVQKIVTEFQELEFTDMVKAMNYVVELKNKEN